MLVIPELNPSIGLFIPIYSIHLGGEIIRSLQEITRDQLNTGVMCLAQERNIFIMTLSELEHGPLTL